MPNEQPEMTQQTAGMKILDKKLDGYYSKNNDLLAANELTVTITLAEYRELIGNTAKYSLEIEKLDRELTIVKKKLEATKADLEHVRGLIAIKQASASCGEEPQDAQES